MPSRDARKLTQDERSALSDQRLIDAAIALIVKAGTAGATLQALGETSGYSRGQVTYRFGSKAALFKTVIRQVSERWMQALDARVGNKTGMEALLACDAAYFEFLQDFPDDIHALNVLMQHACQPDSELKEIVVKVKQARARQLRSWILQGKDENTIRADIDADAFAAHYISYHAGLGMLWMLDRDSFDWSRVHAFSRSQFIDYLTANPAV